MAQTVELLKRLADGGVEFIVIGGVATVAYGAAYSTIDVDVCAPLDHANAVRIIRALDGLHPRWLSRPDLPPITPDDTSLDGLKNMYLRTDLGRLDVLGEVPGVCTYVELVGRSIEMNFDGTLCRMIDLDTLLAAKRVAGRDKDKLAIRELESVKKCRDQNPGLFDNA